ncbi:hypothetical protein AGRA3207_000669 [Actinomadura graeca]|uniref:DUF3040 domain-containing protein n=1 Tax=Actinomadura graeca TaxID=2750812 RepID=A0ABX8QMW2_9ACTN|nr:hypothetical protein [Actinomadura graeca]QXJ20038.1 hypothetical protein AGRA3207_000669 [Actinomadura graeca]
MTTTTPRLPREDLRAALAARRELGPDYDEAFIETVVSRIEETLAVRAGGAAMPEPEPRRPRRAAGERDHSLAMAVLSLLAAIPLSAIAVVNAGLPGLLFTCTMIVLVNVTYTCRPRRP